MSHVPPIKKGWLAHYSELVGTWARRIGASHDAEDAAHDAITRMLESETSHVKDSRAYLSRSVANGLASQYRRQQIVPMLPLDELAEDEHPMADDAEAAARFQQLSSAFLEALSELPAASQQVFAWHRVEGRTIPEIAAKMNLSVSSVEKHLTRAIRHLHLRLERFSP